MVMEFIPQAVLFPRAARGEPSATSESEIELMPIGKDAAKESDSEAAVETAAEWGRLQEEEGEGEEEASTPQAAVASSPWYECDDGEGRRYYHNYETLESVWELPPGVEVVYLEGPTQVSDTSTAASHTATAEGEGGGFVDPQPLSEPGPLTAVPEESEPVIQPQARLSKKWRQSSGKAAVQQQEEEGEELEELEIVEDAGSGKRPSTRVSVAASGGGRWVKTVNPMSRQVNFIFVDSSTVYFRGGKQYVVRAKRK
jgi:hypothetical protein